MSDTSFYDTYDMNVVDNTSVKTDLNFLHFKLKRNIRSQNENK